MENSKEFNEFVDRALVILSKKTRSQYAKNVILGHQIWSGADLKGAAKKYGKHYADMRRLARQAVIEAGGAVIPVEHGRLILAWLAPGATLYETRRGWYARRDNAHVNYQRVA